MTSYLVELSDKIKRFSNILGLEHELEIIKNSVVFHCIKLEFDDKGYPLGLYQLDDGRGETLLANKYGVKELFLTTSYFKILNQFKGDPVKKLFRKGLDKRDVEIIKSVFLNGGLSGFKKFLLFMDDIIQPKVSYLDRESVDGKKFLSGKECSSLDMYDFIDTNNGCVQYVHFECGKKSVIGHFNDEDVFYQCKKSIHAIRALNFR